MTGQQTTNRLYLGQGVQNLREKGSSFFSVSTIYVKTKINKKTKHWNFEEEKRCVGQSDLHKISQTWFS